jgi:hypothetical protein
MPEMQTRAYAAGSPLFAILHASFNYLPHRIYRHFATFWITSCNAAKKTVKKTFGCTHGLKSSEMSSFAHILT